MKYFQDETKSFLNNLARSHPLSVVQKDALASQFKCLCDSHLFLRRTPNLKAENRLLYIPVIFLVAGHQCDPPIVFSRIELLSNSFEQGHECVFSQKQLIEQVPKKSNTIVPYQQMGGLTPSLLLFKNELDKWLYYLDTEDGVHKKDRPASLRILGKKAADDTLPNRFSESDLYLMFTRVEAQMRVMLSTEKVKVYNDYTSAKALSSFQTYITTQKAKDGAFLDHLLRSMTKDEELFMACAIICRFQHEVKSMCPTYPIAASVVGCSKNQILITKKEYDHCMTLDVVRVSPIQKKEKTGRIGRKIKKEVEAEAVPLVEAEAVPLVEAEAEAEAILWE